MADERIIEYVRQARSAGIADEAIFKELLKVGWPREEVRQALFAKSRAHAISQAPVLIRVTNLSKTYDHSKHAAGTLALQNINMDIHTGEFLAITGKSGSGKSTLLNLLGLIDDPTAGEITVLDSPLSALSEKERVQFRLQTVSFVFQFFNLLDNYTAIDNIIFQLRLQGYRRSQAKKKARDILHFLGIDHKAHSYPKDLSGGEQQRVAVGRALAKDSLFILADEPTAHLDENNSQALIDLLRKINTEHNRTIILVTHELQYTMAADRTAVIQDGNIIALTSDREHIRRLHK
jgi:putative ABC transport system ATP-binding protein